MSPSWNFTCYAYAKRKIFFFFSQVWLTPDLSLVYLLLDFDMCWCTDDKEHITLVRDDPDLSHDWCCQLQIKQQILLNYKEDTDISNSLALKIVWKRKRCWRNWIEEIIFASAEMEKKSFQSPFILDSTACSILLANLSVICKLFQTNIYLCVFLKE